MCLCTCLSLLGERKAFGLDFLAHGDCVLLAPSAPCSCMSYHHDSRRIFIGQDNGAVVVSEANSNKRLQMCSRLTLLVYQSHFLSFFFLNLHVWFKLNIWAPPNTRGGRIVIWFKTCFFWVCVCLLFRSFLSLKISTRWTMSRRIQVRMWDEHRCTPQLSSSI